MHSEQNDLNTKYIAGGLTELLLEAVKKANKPLLFSIKFLYSLKPCCHYIKINGLPLLKNSVFCSNRALNAQCKVFGEQRWKH